VDASKPGSPDIASRSNGPRIRASLYIQYFKPPQDTPRVLHFQDEDERVF
jgi:hypothetical protein